MFAGILSIVLLVALMRLYNRVGRLERRLHLLEAESPGWSSSPLEASVRKADPWTASEAAGPPEPVAPPHLPDVGRPEVHPVPGSPEYAAPAVAEPAAQVPPPDTEVYASEPALHESAEPQRPRPRLSFEDLFGRKLPIWAGGVTLAIAGFLIVKYSIDTGLLSPAVRVMSGLLFGLGLIGAAEAARRLQARVQDPRVGQALAGAGVATLYGSILVAGNVFGLIGPGAAFLGLAAVTAVALGLAMRFGAPSALLGLIGGFTAPLFVGSTEPNLPLLTIYLALTVGGLSAIARAQGWAWLGYAGLAGGFLWSAVLIAEMPASAGNSMALGLYLLLLALAMPSLALTSHNRTRGAISAGVGALQLAALVAHNGFKPLDWMLFGLLSIGVQLLARQQAGLRLIRPAAFGAALLLLAAWPEPDMTQFTLALGAMLLIHGGPALFDLWRPKGGVIEAVQVAGGAFAVWLLPLIHFHLPNGGDFPFALLAVAGGAITGGAAGLGWRCEARSTDFRFPLLVIAASLSAAAAAAIAAPEWQFAPWLGAIGAGVLAVALLANDRRVERAAWVGLAVSVLALLATPANQTALTHALGSGEAGGWRSTAALFLIAVIATGFAWRSRIGEARGAAQVVAATLGYAALAQLLPIRFVPLLASGLLAAVATAGTLSAKRLLPGTLALAFVVLLWAIDPASWWLVRALGSAAGEPMLVIGLPAPEDVLLRLFLPGAALGLACHLAMRGRDPNSRLAILGVPAALLLIAVHLAYKQLFGIADAAAFTRLGFAERTLWEGLLIGAGMMMLRRQAAARAGLLLMAAGLAHFAWFSVLLHNPLWWPQEVGPVPLFNLLLPAYGLALIASWLIGREVPAFDRALQIGRMLLIVLLGWSLLRQALHGSLLFGAALGPGEDVARSVLILAFGIGFLLWGIARGGRDWRIASLVLMLGAAAKVFLWDAAGLDGLLRIGSFVALGFSLIGIGWLYARFVSEKASPSQS